MKSIFLKHTKFLSILLIVPLLLGACSPVSLAASVPAIQLDQVQRTRSSTQNTSALACNNNTSTDCITQVNSAAPTTGTVSSPAGLAALQASFEDVYSLVNPSVVNLQVTSQTAAAATTNRRSTPFNSQPQESTPTYGEGSGFVWDTQGHIVTNNHVVADATAINVTFADGTQAEAKVVGTDPRADLAVIQVDVPAAQLFPIQLADSKQARVGQIVIAIGNPFGLQGSMTQGIISALSRTMPASEDTSTGPSYSIPDVIQTDAAINPGNSGGVLVDLEGKLLGITTAIESPVRANSGVGYVVPSAIIQRVVPTLISKGSYDHPWLGISGGTLTPTLAKAMNLDQQQGVLVAEVTANGPAAKAGLKGSDHKVSLNGSDVSAGGDVITSINGVSLKRFEDLVSYLFNNAEAGQTVSLTIVRDGKEQTVSLTLGSQPKS